MEKEKNHLDRYSKEIFYFFCMPVIEIKSSRMNYVSELQDGMSDGTCLKMKCKFCARR